MLTLCAVIFSIPSIFTFNRVKKITTPIPSLNRDLQIETKGIEMSEGTIIEEDVKTPGGTTIRRRMVQI